MKGKRTGNTMICAVSALGADRPSVAKPQQSVYENSNTMPTPTRNQPKFVEMRKPTAKPTMLMSTTTKTLRRRSAEVLRNVFVVVLISAVGFAVGFRISTNVGLFLCGLAIVLLFAYTLCWGFATVGLSASNAETAQIMVFPILFPLIFASSAFVPVSSMPGWLQAFAKHQPVTQVVDAARSLMVGGSLQDTGAVWASLAWCAGLLLLLVPLAVRKYRRVA